MNTGVPEAADVDPPVNGTRLSARVRASSPVANWAVRDLLMFILIYSFDERPHTGRG
jgi:hypothetical protein